VLENHWQSRIQVLPSRPSWGLLATTSTWQNYFLAVSRLHQNIYLRLTMEWNTTQCLVTKWAVSQLLRQAVYCQSTL